jgi:chromosome segregation ATPase
MQLQLQVSLNEVVVETDNTVQKAVEQLTQLKQDAMQYLPTESIQPSIKLPE